MAALDPKVAAIVDSATKDDDSDEDALIAALEDDSELDAFREQRRQQLHAEFDKARQLRATGHGTYAEIKDEKALMDITTSTKLCVVHFFKPDFNRCRIMDSHLEVGTAIGTPGTPETLCSCVFSNVRRSFSNSISLSLQSTTKHVCSRSTWTTALSWSPN
jgi:hypothetical protein